MALLSDKEQKKLFKIEASKNPEKYYPVKALKRNGFHREQCIKCGRFFWTSTDRKVCGEPECNEGFQVVKNNPTKNKLSFIGVWKKIVEILEPRGYKPIKRYPVVARWNPTTDFTIASIAAFQPYVISGEVPPPAKKLLIPQFCLRFGDIENVGITGSHCTGFVMIGQHQFVSPEEWDQDQAFQDILDFLLEGVGLDKSEVSIQEDAWAGGGNFGPCMEFFSRGVELFNQVYMMFQQTPNGPEPLKLKVLDMGLGQERVAWFSQGTPNMYEAIFPEVLKKLRERTNIELDHELYNKFSQYSAFLNIDEVDNLEDAWKRVAEKIGVDVEEIKRKIIPMTAIYSIAEHARSLLFAISDGMLPSNVGGGYNLRIILRRALSFIDKFGWDIDLGEVCEWHAKELYELFPEVSENLDEVKEILNVEKRKFFETRKKAKKIVENLLKRESDISVDKLIELYDSNGIDPDMVRDAAQKMGKKVEIPDNFYQLVLARHENKTQVHATHKKIDLEVEDLPPTQSLYFDNYLDLENDAKVLRLKKIQYEMEEEEDDAQAYGLGDDKGSDQNKEQTVKRTVWACVLDRSVAYPTSGGQLHDIGTINDVNFIDCLKVGPCVVHILEKEPGFKEGDTVHVKIDKTRRIILTQHHSATHLVNAAARELLGSHINQAGAKKTLAKAHLDITHYESLSDEQLMKIEEIANSYVERGVDSNNRFMSRAEAERIYGMRLYQGGAVPGSKIRVVEFPGIEVEACGGTHVNNTREVGRIKIIRSQKIQDGIVRLTFTAGLTTERLMKYYERIIANLAEILECEKDEIEARSIELLKKWKGLRKAKSKGVYSEDLLSLTEHTKNSLDDLHYLLKKMATNFNSSIDLLPKKIGKLKEEWRDMVNEIERISKIVGEKNIADLLSKAVKHRDLSIVSAVYEGIDNKVSDSLIKGILKNENKAVILILAENKGGYNVICARGKDSDLQKYNMAEICKTLLSKFSGKGGGKPERAQGFIRKSDDAKLAEKIIEEFINGIKSL